MRDADADSIPAGDHAPADPSASPPGPSTGGARGGAIDAGWLFLAAGAAVLGAAVLIPSIDDLAGAQRDRDLALSYERHREARLASYRSFAGRLDAPDRSLAVHLARTQLNLVPEEETAVLTRIDAAERSAAVLPSIEPAYVPPRTTPVRPSLLRRLATGDRSRLLLIAGGAVCVLLGLLPPARPGAAA